MKGHEGKVKREGHVQCHDWLVPSMSPRMMSWSTTSQSQRLQQTEGGKAMRESSSEASSIGHALASKSGTEVSSELVGLQVRLRRRSRKRGASRRGVDDSHSCAGRWEREVWQRIGVSSACTTRPGKLRGVETGAARQLLKRQPNALPLTIS